jgi:predicted S18 family serine protease
MILSRVLLIGAALSVGSCASKPPVPSEQLAVSKAAIEQAQRAQANEYASVELRQAEDKLSLAYAAVQREDYAAAKRLAEQAEVDARHAETKSHSTRARNAVAEINESIQALRQELERKGESK